MKYANAIIPKQRISSLKRPLKMVVTSALFYFFIAITLCTFACGLYVVAEKVWGSRDRVEIKRLWSMRRKEGQEAGRGHGDEEANVAR